MHTLRLVVVRSARQSTRSWRASAAVSASPCSSAAVAAAAVVSVRGAATSAPPVPFVNPKTLRETFLSGSSAVYAEDIYEKYQKDPNSVHTSWREYFRLLESGESEPFAQAPTLGAALTALPSEGTAAGSTPSKLKEIHDHIRVQQLIRAFQIRGHRLAGLDPLYLQEVVEPEALTLAHYGFGPADLQRTFLLPPESIFSQGATSLTLGEIVDRLKAIYCRNVGYEYMHIQTRTSCNWLRERIELPAPTLSKATKLAILEDLDSAEGFEETLKAKFGSEKRFGLEGCESLIPALRQVIKTGSALGIDMVVFGMAHRGRLNVLHNVLGKPMEVVLKEFKSTLAPDDEGSGDVMYHRGTYSDLLVPSTQRNMHLSLMPNPSHLEAVNPVVLGRVRAEQQLQFGGDTTKVVGVLIHGDAAFVGQGVTMETMGMSALRDYSTGGTIHVVINNQIGFTTDPSAARSSEYCTDLAKTIDAPVLHVNADSPEDVVRAMSLAVEWRQTFGKDVVVDLVCYRRNGHNETDQAAYTNPGMCDRILQTKPVRSLYASALIESGIASEGEVNELQAASRAKFQAAVANKDNVTLKKQEYYPAYWHAFKRRAAEFGPETGAPVDMLKLIARNGTMPPADFNLQSQLRGILERRVNSVESDQGMDWATAEQLAFGSLLMEGAHVRLSGQDVERGTFSQRHHVLHDQTRDGERCTPLRNICPPGVHYTVSNSHLSEFAVLGFELGYTYPYPFSLVCWEAQFGDFANGASCIIDNFLAAGERKWGPQSALVMLLPHGYEGMGPEHSSARLERFLQMSEDDEATFPACLAADPSGEKQIEQSNWVVGNCSTPANYFHALRRQLHRNFRKPLILMTPKYLLRHPRARSQLADLAPGSRFQRLIPETDPTIFSHSGVPNPSVTRLVLCSGKIYYELLERREKLGEHGVALARVEQISPFPFDLVQKHVDDFPNAEVVWCQEEPKNMGAWAYVRPRIETALRQSRHHVGQRPRYVGRAPSAATATGDKRQHVREQTELVEAALHIGREPNV